MGIFDARVDEIIKRTHNVTSFRLIADEDLFFRAGQFFQLTLMVNGQEQSKYFSFSNSPTETGYIEFTKKMTESEFSKALEGLKPGDTVKVKMPMGNFILEETDGKIAFLSGGIGITPIRSILKCAFDSQWPGSIVLFYSNRAPEDIVFREELEAMAREHPDFKIVLSLDTPGACPADWKGKCGFINTDMIQEEMPDYSGRTFYVCGPPVMVKHMVDMLQTELQVGDERIKRENFAGY